MKNLFSSMLSIFPSKDEVKKAILLFSKREYFIFLGLVVILCISTLAILSKINKAFLVTIPAEGGILTEGIVGTPRFINPILATSLADQDLTSLVYSGLMRKDSSSKLIPDLAVSYEVSKDGLSYTFTLRDNIYFHDGKRVTVDDVIFTINALRDPVVTNPKKNNWENVNIEKKDDKTILFTISRPYASFLENTTLGIMPKHLWDRSPIELNETNINAIGSGPYKVKNIDKQSNGLINFYELESYKKYALGKPYIKNIILKFYANEEEMLSSLKNGEIQQASSITPSNALKLKDEDYRIESLTLPRIFGLFFNQSQNQIFTDKKITKAIGLAINKDNIVQDVLKEYGIVIDDPIPLNMLNYQKIKQSSSASQEEKIAQAEDILKKDGWIKGEDGFLEKTKTEKKVKTVTKLEFAISTSNAPELTRSATLIKEDLGKIGIKVEIKTFEIGNLNQSVIRPRKYDALLFGQIINNESDLFAFWHSSQRKDPGLNVALYTNAKVDKILEDAFITTDENLRIKKYAEFENEIEKDIPAIFLYSPDFIYLISKNVKGFALDQIITPPDRFLNSYLWYIETDNVWKIFQK